MITYYRFRLEVYRTTCEWNGGLDLLTIDFTNFETAMDWYSRFKSEFPELISDDILKWISDNDSPTILRMYEFDLVKITEEKVVD